MQNINRRKVKQCFCQKENLLMIFTVLSVILAVILNFPLREMKLSAKTIHHISMPGVILMNVLKMLILPLITCSLLSGVTSLNLKTSGKMGIYGVSYYVTTTLLAAILGIILVVIIHPGEPSIKDNIDIEKIDKEVETVDALVDLLKNIFPANIVRALIQQEQTDYTYIPGILNETTNITTGMKTKISTSYADNTNFLGLIFFTCFFGIIVASMGDSARPLVDIIQILNDVSMRMISVVLLYVPIGVFFLVLTSLLKISNIAVIARGLALYIVTVITGLLIHTICVIPLMYFIITRKNPFRLIWNLSRALVTGFVIQSSSATLPVTFKCTEEKQGIDPRVTRFMLPIGAIINMDGTGLYEAIAAIFIAQINGIALPIGKLVTISLTATLAAVGAATVPSAGLVTLLIVLTSAGLPTQEVSLLYSMDWFLDRCRTSVNVLGDAFGCGIVEHLCKKELALDKRRASMIGPSSMALKKFEVDENNEE